MRMIGFLIISLIILVTVPSLVSSLPVAHASGICHIVNVTLKHPDTVQASSLVQTATQATSDCFAGSYFYWVRVDLIESNTSKVLSSYRYHWISLYYPDVTTFITPWILNNVTARASLGYWPLTLHVYLMDTDNSAIQFAIKIAR